MLDPSDKEKEEEIHTTEFSESIYFNLDICQEIEVCQESPESPKEVETCQEKPVSVSSHSDEERHENREGEELVLKRLPVLNLTPDLTKSEETEGKTDSPKFEKAITRYRAKESPILISSDSDEEIYKSLEKDSEGQSQQTTLNHTKFKETENKTDSPDSEKEISRAFEDSVKEASILPILKQELRLKIQTRRLGQGKEELKTEKEEPKVYELTEEEKEKYQRRLEQNRQSLHRSRQKSLQHEENLKMKVDAETARNLRLRKMREKLLLEKDNLLKELHNAGMEMDHNTSTITCKRCKMMLLYLVPR